MRKSKFYLKLLSRIELVGQVIISRLSANKFFDDFYQNCLQVFEIFFIY